MRCSRPQQRTANLTKMSRHDVETTARRSWRDLQRPAPSLDEAASAKPLSARQAVHDGDGDLKRAAELAPDSSLKRLLEQRDELHRRLQRLTGSGDEPSARFAARFPVAGAAERRSEARVLEERWQQARQRLRDRSQDLIRGRTVDGPSSSLPGIRRTPLMRQVTERVTDVPATGLAVAASGLRRIARRPGPGRSLLERGDAWVAPLARADAALSAPKALVDTIATRWREREQQITGSMDRVSSYARDRDRRLSPVTGGSGDLSERMDRNRLAALGRRRDVREQDDHDQRRRDRAHVTRMDRRATSATSRARPGRDRD